MDFVMGLPLTPSKKDSIWVIDDRFTKCAHFLPVHTTCSLQRLAELFIVEIVRLHGVPLSIISDRDLSFQASIQMAQFKALYGCKCRTPLFWTELSEKRVVGSELIQETEDKVKLIKDRLKVSPWKKVLRFGSKGNLSLRFIGLFERKYRLDPSHVISVDEVEVREDFSYEEEHVKILARDVEVFLNKVVPLVKVFWRNHNTEEATWMMEESMRAQFP
ncbi:uncharacterized protein LOC120170703 [Hibiscus syriacus]|uniref:uncharacterized protein LOC120170703 n=1 Tax=Hibiscus syriacus TaxID=106335 RepID=UPI001923EA84|nr:uncharacterized protein LOC120170703 [Hibiscus syriacus]